MAVDERTPGIAAGPKPASENPTVPEPGVTGARKKLEAGPVSFAERYQRRGHIDSGGMGQIESAFDPVLGRSVAVKVLQPFADEDQELARKFVAEAQITGQLDHPNIVPVYDLGEHDDKPFIVMKLVRGRTFAALLAESSGPRGADELQLFLGILLRVCDALSFAHSRGVIHCDLKPENVMVGDHGQVYLMDWGVAFVAPRPSTDNSSQIRDDDDQFSAPVRLSSVPSASTAHTGMIKGTPAYMAPEQLRGRDDLLDGRTDVFGLGGLLHEILTASAPNGGGRLLGPALAGEPIDLPRENVLWTRLPPELVRITIKALAPNPDDRYQSVLELKADLERFLSGDRWFEAKHFRAGDYIITQGDAGDAAYIIERGECEVRRGVGDQSSVLRRLGPGSVFGETAVFTRAPRTASVVAITDVTVKLITADSLNRELDRNPWLGAFVRSLAGLFREADQRLSTGSET
ncbi:MAG TPA: serine/threonine-protein kinase [Polyangiaceae bacterium]|nr:serine/threonine-protein kinase [Polyangiaceae bacterium]